jgi:hypothetical protein
MSVDRAVAFRASSSSDVLFPHSTKESLEAEITARVGKVLRTLHEVSATKTKQFDEAKKLDAERRFLLMARDQLMPGTREYTGLCIDLESIAKRREQYIESSKCLADFETLIPVWYSKETDEIESLQARRDALKK